MNVTPPTGRGAEAHSRVRQRTTVCVPLRRHASTSKGGRRVRPAVSALPLCRLLVVTVVRPTALARRPRASQHDMFVAKRLLWSTGKEAGESFAGTATTLHAKGSGGGGGGSRGGGAASRLHLHASASSDDPNSPNRPHSAPAKTTTGKLQALSLSRLQVRTNTEQNRANPKPN